MKPLWFIALMAAGLNIIPAGTTAIWAVQTGYEVHNTEKQFKDGEPNSVLISSEGELSLGWRTNPLLSDGNDVWVVNAVVEAPDGSVYAASSGQGYIHRLRKGAPPEIIYGRDPNDQRHVFSLALDHQGRLLAGTGGETAQLLRYDPNGQWESLYSAEDINYIWTIVATPQGRLYLATGPTGKVLTLDRHGNNPEVIYTAKEKNILSLALNADGILFAGGDEEGLIYRIDPATKKMTIAYDSPHSEISALVFDSQGNLYASTADASAARPGAKLILSDGETSRPETTPKKIKLDKQEKHEQTAPPAGSEPEKEDNDEDIADNDPNSPAGNLAPTDEPQPGDNTNATDGARKVVAAATVQTARSPRAKKGPSLPKSTKDAPAGGTNDVYRITPAGYVSTVLSQPVVILALARTADDKLLLGTGNEGQLLLLDVARQEALILHDAQPSVQVSALAVGPAGTIYAGCANPGAVIAIEPTYATYGEYVSAPIDAEQISRWGKIQIEADVPSDTTLTMSARTGNIEDPDKGGWADWAEPMPVTEDIVVDAPAGRFLQYRLAFGSADGKATAVVREIKLAYMTGNLAPKVQSVEVTRPGPAPKKNANPAGPRTASKIINIKWQASDDNEDDLIYEVFVRHVGRGRWVRIGEDLDTDELPWDTLTVPDGRYEIKVSACDAPSNAQDEELTDSRISRPVIVDNTPPEICQLAHSQNGSVVYVQAQINDELSAIGSVHYSINSAEDWQFVLPQDGIYDSSTEKISFDLDLDEPGEHLLAIRFDDALANTTYRHLTLIVPE